MSFHDVQFPTDVDYGFTGGPRFSTRVQAAGSGKEQRFVRWDASLGRWNLSKSLQDFTAIELVQAFFYARQGRGYAFRFKAWEEYQATDQNIGTGTGAALTFQLRKRYTSGATTHDRNITKPVDGTVVIKVAGVTKTEGPNPGGDYEIDYLTGIVTFNAGKAPAAAAAVTWSGEFDVPARFDTDELAITVDDGGDNFTLADLPIVEIRE